MKNHLLRFRYYLEMIALPAFIFMVVHLSGHGILLLQGEEHHHHHGHHEEIHEEHEEHEEHEVSEGHHDEAFSEVFDVHEWMEMIFTVEVLSGVLFLILFTWLWHRPALRKWVPCSHDHCHNELSTSHVLAIIALCLHFFPEAEVRHELLQEIFSGDAINTIGLVGFGAHFLVDVIVAIIISSYWKTRQAQILSFLFIAAVWIVALKTSGEFLEHAPPESEGMLFLVSAFLLAMFVHKPHKPVICGKCEER